MVLKNISLWNSTLLFNFWIIILKLLQVPSVMESHHDNHNTLLYFYIEDINILLWLWFLIVGLIREIPLDINHLIHGQYQAAFIRTKSCVLPGHHLLPENKDTKWKTLRSFVISVTHRNSFWKQFLKHWMCFVWKKRRGLGLQHLGIFKDFDYPVCKHLQINSEM